MIDIYSFSRGISIGILLLLCFKIWLDYWPLIAGRLLFALFVGLQAYLIHPLLSSEVVIYDFARWPLAVLATLITPLFWLFCESVFYDWDKNAGYGTKKHIEQIHKNGITDHHRKSFEPIKSLIHT